ncbi:MAG: sensor histidine kinase [Methanobacteriota archaeon]
MSRPLRASDLLWGSVVVLAYVAAGLAGLRFAVVNESATAVWPPTGIAIGSLVVLGLRFAPAIFVGAFATNILTAGTVATSLAIAAGNMLEGLVAAGILLRFAGGRHTFSRNRGVFVFAAAVPVAGLASASIGVAALAYGGLVAPGTLGDVWATWWLGDIVGGLIFAPLLVTFAAGFDRSWYPKRLAEGLLMVGAGALLAFALFSPVLREEGVPFAFPVIPFLVWAGLRFGPQGASLLMAIVSLIAVLGTAGGFGQFAAYGPASSIVLSQLLSGVATLISLTVAATASESAASRAALVEALAGLDARVRERTAELTSRERALAQAQAIAKFGSFDWDVAADRVAWSDELHRIYGIGPGVFGGRMADFTARVHPDDRARVVETVERALETREPVTFEERILRPDGSVGVLVTRAQAVEEHGRLRFVGVCQDVTARWGAEEKYRELLEAAPDAVLVADADGRIVVANAQAERMFGYTRAEVVGQKIEMLLPERFRERHMGHRSAYAAAPKTRPMGTGMELFARKKDGTEIPVEVSLSRLATRDGLLVTSVLRDLTERKRTEAAERAAFESRVEIERLREMDGLKTHLLNTASHELNTPLTPLKLLIHRLKREHAGPLTAGQRRTIDILDRNIERLSVLVRNMLDVSRIQAGRLKLDLAPVDVNRAISEAAETFEEPARVAGVELRSFTTPGIVVRADVGRLTQVLFNLVSNALKFTPAGGRITIESAREGPEAVIRVRDTGAGLSEDQRARLFQPFVQVHDTTRTGPGGTGLGLYISRGIVEALGGRIRVESDGPRKGSTFVVTLPLAAPPPTVPS